jgi:hypothetical protein
MIYICEYLCKKIIKVNYGKTMTLKLKVWTGLGLGTVLLGTSLVACSSPSDQIQEENAEVSMTTDVSEPAQKVKSIEYGEGGESGESGTSGGSMEVLPIENRLAFMTGHVEAGLALYRAGKLEQAAPHLLHPVSETHQSERQGLDALGFEASLFKSVSEALSQGRPASEIQAELIAAEANLNSVAKKAGGSHADIIRFLMDKVVEEYSVALNDGVISEPGEYQDAFGFAVVARAHAEQLNVHYKTAVLEEINELISFWPEAPIPSPSPTSVAQVIAKASAVQLALPAD